MMSLGSLPDGRKSIESENQQNTKLACTVYTVILHGYITSFWHMTCQANRGLDPTAHSWPSRDFEFNTRSSPDLIPVSPITQTGLVEQHHRRQDAHPFLQDKEIVSRELFSCFLRAYTRDSKPRSFS